MRLIDADALKNKMHKVCGYPGRIYESDLDDAPTVPQTHAHWIQQDCARANVPGIVLVDKCGFVYESCFCSACGEWLSGSDEYAVKGRYCPNCGAKMDEEEGK